MGLYEKNEPHMRSRDLKKQKKKNTSLATIVKYGSAKDIDPGWPSKGQDAMSKVRFGLALTKIMHNIFITHNHRPSLPSGDFADECDPVPFRDAMRHKYSIHKR